MSEHDQDDGPVEGQQQTAKTIPCAQCGAELEFNPSIQQLNCQYCGHGQTIEVSPDAQVIEYDLGDAIQRYLGRVGKIESSNRREVSCQDCGAEISVESGATTASCDYCGGKRIIERELPEGMLRPEGLLPFQFQGPDAIEKFRVWLAGDGFFARLCVKLFRPGALQSRNSVQDLHGVYVPFWTYDTQSHSNWTAQAGYYYYVSESYTDSEGNRKTRQVRKIRWRWASGSRRDAFDDWLVCASRHFHAGDLHGLMKDIEPFPTQQLVPFDDKYLSGFRNEIYSVDLKAGWNIARAEIQSELRSRCARDVPGDTHRFLSVSSSFFGQSFKHIVLPVFVMSYQFKEKSYNVLVNGSTGEVRGKAPISWIKVTIFTLVCLAIIAGLVGLYYALRGNAG